MRTRGSKLRRKTSLQKCQILENLLGNIEIFPSRNLIFLNGFPILFNGFLLSSTAFQFSSTAYRFPRNPRKSIYGGKYTKDHYSSFVFPATCSPSFVIPFTMSTSPQHLEMQQYVPYEHCFRGAAPNWLISLWNHSQSFGNHLIQMKCLLFAHYNLRTDQFDTPNL